MPPLLSRLVLSALAPSDAPFDLTPLEVHALCQEKGLDTALDAFQSCVERHSEKLGAAIETAMRVDGLLEWFICRLTEQSYTTLRYHVLKDFPEESISKFFASHCYRMLLQFQKFLSWADTAIAQRNHRDLSNILPLLETLRHCCTDTSDARQSAREDVSFTSSAPFDRAGVTEPRTLNDARKLARRMLNTLKQTLKTYFDLFRDGGLVEGMRRTIRSSLSRYQTQVHCNDDLCASCPDEPDEPALPHKKAVIVLDSIEGFGACKITVSSRMVHHMRASRSRPRLFSQINKKLRELSHGHVDGENGIILNAVDGMKLIYAARVSPHCAIAYCIARSSNASHQQALPEIRIFGVYQTQSIEDQAFWNAVGDELHLRERPESSREAALRPLKDPAVQERIRALIVLDKVVELSAPVLRSIMDDEEVQVAFELSMDEREVVHHEGSCYVLGRSGTGKTTAVVYKMLGIECSWSLFADEAYIKPRQLFVTRSQNLADKVKESFKGLYQSHVVGRNRQASNTPDATQQWVTDLPSRFGNLDTKNFPLFISLDELYLMLEREIGLVKDGSYQMGNVAVSYEVFLAHYWSNFPSGLTKGLDPFLVFGEFIGVIKGSEQTIGTPKGYLDHHTYVNLSVRTFRTFAGQRDAVYKLFERYLQQQRMLKQIDIADRTHAILRGFQENLPSWLESIDYIYVDEAQDNLLIDALLLRLLCKNSDGLFWAGDTAQTIFAGNSFTFNELRSFFHRIEEKHAYRKASTVEPRFFKLATNFRSQAGIVLCGEGVLQLIGQVWPASIDQVPKEMNLRAGNRPLFFRDGQLDVKNLNLNSCKTIEFGAEQCILVRNERIREELAPRLHYSTLILTLYESKGLEFNDVIILDFFEDSQCTQAQWKTLKDVIATGVDDVTNLHRVHGGLLAELKYLYVAITRARLRLWIVDSSEKASAMHTYLSVRNEVETADANVEIAEFAIASDSSAWDRKGRELFSEKRYRLAGQAFRSGGNDYDADIAKAFELQEQIALVLPSGRREANLAAANSFVTVAAEAKRRQDSRSKTFYQHAVDCYLQVPDIRQSARACLDGGDINRALHILRDAALFDEVVQVLLEHHEEIDPKLRGKVMYAAGLFYVRGPDVAKAGALFNTPAGVFKFAEEHGLRRAQGTILEYQSLYSIAAEFYLERNQPVKALKFYRLASEHEQQPKTLNTPLLLEALWKEPSFSYHPDCASAVLSERAQALLHLINFRDQQRQTQGLTGSATADDHEVDLFEVIACGQSHDVLRYYRLLSSEDPPRRAGALLALSHSIRFSPASDTIENHPWVSIPWLIQLLQYMRLLRSMIAEGNLTNNPDVQRLMGFRPLTTNEFRLLPGSASIVAFGDHNRLRKRSQDAVDGVMEKEPLETALRKHLSQQLLVKVPDAIRWCGKGATTISAASSTQDIHAALRIISLLIIIYDSVRGIERPGPMAEKRRQLIGRLFSVLTILLEKVERPPISLPAKSVPELAEAALVVKMWTSDYLRCPTDVVPEEFARNLLSLSYKAASIRCVLESNEAFSDNKLSLCDTATLDRYDCIHDLVCLLQGSLASGVRLLTNIVYDRAPVDSAFICDLVDILVCGFSLALAKKAIPGVLGATLPSGCNLFIIQSCSIWVNADTRSLDLFLRVAEDLIKLLSNLDGGDWLFAAEAPVKQGYAVQRGVIGRICDSFILLGMNVANEAFRRRIIAIIRPLRNSGVRIHGIQYLSVVKADTWDQLLDAPLRILSYLNFRAEKQDIDGRKVIKIFELSKHEVESLKEHGRLPSMVMEAVYENTLSQPQLSGVIGYCRFQDAMKLESPSEQIVSAATRIQAFLRSAHRRRRPLAISSLAHLRQQAHKLSLNYLVEHPQLPTFARMILLGTIPHALACLSALKLLLQVSKDTYSRELQQVNHRDLEKAGERASSAHADIMRVESLEKTLRPSSGLFTSTVWWDVLQSKLKGVEELLEKLPQCVERRDIEDEWALVKKAILT